MKLERWSVEQYDEFLSTSYEYLEERQQHVEEEFAIGSYERFDWNQETGEIIFSDRAVSKVLAKFQFVGSLSKQTGTWLWAWASDSTCEDVKVGSRKVKEFGERHGLEELTTDYWEATEEDGWAMTALTANILGAKGAYRSPHSHLFSFMVFTDIRWAT